MEKKSGEDGVLIKFLSSRPRSGCGDPDGQMETSLGWPALVEQAYADTTAHSAHNTMQARKLLRAAQRTIQGRLMTGIVEERTQHTGSMHRERTQATPGRRERQGCGHTAEPTCPQLQMGPGSTGTCWMLTGPARTVGVPFSERRAERQTDKGWGVGGGPCRSCIETAAKTLRSHWRTAGPWAGSCVAWGIWPRAKPGRRQDSHSHSLVAIACWPGSKHAIVVMP
ncbi:hypothetical protein G7Z17_g6353 [Cylindrodendrum hubeiense]|uniref:Uncharacterized protein n=1 Tax=Cylindrodendrum hubeiense TaxID=595255 RepID=A0A9P5H4U7_9HYPO|nr:hypothetical protein G7Z17_g6353 [Cylindrodendrum hubeiense]